MELETLLEVDIGLRQLALTFVVLVDLYLAGLAAHNVAFDLDFAICVEGVMPELGVKGPV